MFNLFGMSRPKFNSERPTTETACEHLEHLVSRRPNKPAEYTDQTALLYISDQAHLSDPKIQELVFNCLKLTVPGKDFDWGRVKGTPCLARTSLGIIGKFPHRFHQFSAPLIEKFSSEHPDMAASILSALGALSREKWPQGLGDALGKSLSSPNIRSHSLRFCISHGAAAAADLDDMRPALTAAAKDLLNPGAHTNDTALLLCALGTLGMVTPDLHPQIQQLQTHSSGEIRSAAIFAFASAGLPMMKQWKAERERNGFLSENLVRGAVAMAPHQQGARPMVNSLLNLKEETRVAVLRVLREALPEIQRLFAAELTLIAFATDTYSEHVVGMAREVLRSCGTDIGVSEAGESESFFTFTASEKLRDSLELLTAVA